MLAHIIKSKAVIKCFKSNEFNSGLNSRYITMKQITLADAKKLALENKIALMREISYCSSDWIRENSYKIAEIETKRADKTYFGLWQKGWKKAMIKEATDVAEKKLLDDFTKKECFILDGVIWLNNLQIINSLYQNKYLSHTLTTSA